MANALALLTSAFLPRQKAGPSVSPVSDRGWYRVLESYTGAWQRNVVVDRETVLSYHAVYACMTLIASDIAKLRVKLVEQDANGIWTETESPAFSPVLRKPNRFQNRIQFWECWILSKLSRGNTYALKQRDQRGVVVAEYVLDPNRVKPMIADDGSIWYSLAADNLAGGELMQDVMVPASEVIHDRFNCLFHPLIGTSPIFAAGVAATQGLNIQNNSATFFGNASRPSGILSADGEISDAMAARLKAYWEENFTGSNAGKVAVLGDGLQYQKMTMTAEESQLIDQLKWTAEVVCSTFHVPPYKIGVGPVPTYNNIQSLNVEYYSQCLQSLIEAAELCQDEGLGIGVGVKTRKVAEDGEVGGRTLGTEFDVENLLRMDSVTQMEVLDKSKGILTPNEQRAKLDKKPKAGGDSPMLQQQNFSLEALSKRDAKDDPFGTAKQAPATPVDPAANNNGEEAREARSLRRRKMLATLLDIDTIPIGTHSVLETRGDPGRAMVAQGASR